MPPSNKSIKLKLILDNNQTKNKITFACLKNNFFVNLNGFTSLADSGNTKWKNGRTLLNWIE